MKPSEVLNRVEISNQDFKKYAAGETIELAEPQPNGWYQLVLGGNGLGFAKVTGKTLKHYFPKGLRFR